MRSFLCVFRVLLTITPERALFTGGLLVFILDDDWLLEEDIRQVRCDFAAILSDVNGIILQGIPSCEVTAGIANCQIISNGCGALLGIWCLGLDLCGDLLHPSRDPKLRSNRR